MGRAKFRILISTCACSSAWESRECDEPFEPFEYVSIAKEYHVRVLVTGGAGFIGSHIVDAFIARGDEVVIIDNMSSGSNENLNPKAEFVHGDITDAPLI